METFGVIMSFALVSGSFGAGIVWISMWLIKELPNPRISVLVVMVLNAALLVGCFAIPFLLWYSDNFYDNFSFIYHEGFWGLVIAIVYGSVVGLVIYGSTYLRQKKGVHFLESKGIYTGLLLLNWLALTFGLICSLVTAFGALGGK